MTQPTEEGAVGGVNDEPVVAAEPTLEDRFTALGDDDEAEEAPQPEAEDEEPLASEDEAEEGEADEEPPIAPPVSWTAEEKEAFNGLPRALQETVTRREADRERFVQSKAQEAKQARSQAEREALTVIENVQRQAAERLGQFAAQLAVPEPDPALIAEDPELYAHQLRQHRHYLAQSHQAQQAAAQSQAMADQARREFIEQMQQETRATLQEQFPEYLSPEHGPKLREELGAVAIELGFTPEELQQPDARDVLAMRTVATYKAKAAKYDALMAKQMQGVRAAKALPNVSKPGVPAGKGAIENQRYAADRKAMREGDVDAAARAFARFL